MDALKPKVPTLGQALGGAMGLPLSRAADALKGGFGSRPQYPIPPTRPQNAGQYGRGGAPLPPRRPPDFGGGRLGEPELIGTGRCLRQDLSLPCLHRGRTLLFRSRDQWMPASATIHLHRPPTHIGRLSRRKELHLKAFIRRSIRRPDGRGRGKPPTTRGLTARSPPSQPWRK
jgi:hypothetical protein